MSALLMPLCAIRLKPNYFTARQLGRVKNFALKVTENGRRNAPSGRVCAAAARNVPVSGTVLWREQDKNTTADYAKI